MPKPRSATRHDIETGKRIRAARLAVPMSQADLGDKLGVSFQQVQKYEKGVNRIGSGRMVQIAQAVGVPVDQLMGVDKAARPEPATLTMMASNDGAKLARIFNGIMSPALRMGLIRQAELIKEVDEIAALSLGPMRQAAE